KFTEFKRDEANKMLDGLGLNKKDANGIRLLPNGKPATIEISVVPAFGAWPDVALLVSKDWEAVGIKTIVQIRERALHFKMNENNELMSEIWNEDTSAFPYTGNAKADPRNAPILTMGPLWLAQRGPRHWGGAPPAMTRYILQRLALLPLLMVIYSFVIFAIIQAPPGDFLPAYVATLASSGSSISAEQIAAMRAQYGLDQPFFVQYLLWLQHLVHGDLGLSLEYQRPNAELIGDVLGLTLALALFSFVLTWALAIPAGIYSATHP